MNEKFMRLRRLAESSRPAPFRWFGNQVLQVSCTHIYSASKVFTLPAICCEILSRRNRYLQEAEKWCSIL